MDRDATAVAALVVSLISLVVSVSTIWRLFDRDKVRFRVTHGEYTRADGGGGGVWIDVVNIGYLPITITHIGFEFTAPGLQIVAPREFLNGESLPHRLEARASVRVTYPILPSSMEKNPLLRDDKVAIATTACGKTIRG